MSPEHHLGQYKDTVGELMGRRGLQYVITDSWEADVQNWTDDMMSEFSKRRGKWIRSSNCLMLPPASR